MRASSVITLLLSSVTISSTVQLAELLRFTTSCSELPRASPGSILNSGTSAPTFVPGSPAPEKLDLRQAPAAPAPAVPAPATPPTNPAVPANPAVNPAAAPAIPAAPGAANPTTTPTTPGAPTESITVQWIETWIGGTSQTWVPKTITYHFEAHMSEAQAGQPGKGEIGMGTLTGKLGITKTVVVGGAPTRGVEWAGGVVAMGVGIAGVL